MGDDWALRTKVKCGPANDVTVHATCIGGPIPIAQGATHVFNALLIDAAIGKKGRLVDVELAGDARECDALMGPGPPFNDNGSAAVALGPFVCEGTQLLVERIIVPVAELGGEDAPAGNIGRMELTFEILIDP